MGSRPGNTLADIRWEYRMVHRQSAKGGGEFASTKTGRHRAVPLNPAFASALRAIDRQGEFVFLNEDGTAPSRAAPGLLWGTNAGRAGPHRLALAANNGCPGYSDWPLATDNDVAAAASAEAPALPRRSSLPPLLATAARARIARGSRHREARLRRAGPPQHHSGRGEPARGAPAPFAKRGRQPERL